jgi:hypothetical protein
MAAISHKKAHIKLETVEYYIITNLSHYKIRSYYFVICICSEVTSIHLF